MSSPQQHTHQQPWEPEVTVSEQLACTLISQQFPELAPVQAEPYGAGWDNTAYRINGEYVFRFPRRTIAVSLLESESRVLPGIADYLHLQIPEPVFVGQPSTAFAWLFTGAREIRGTTACRARLTPDERSRLARPLAAFLTTLHSLSPTQVPGVEGDTLGRNDLPRRIDQIRGRIGEAHTLGLIDDTRRFEAILDEVPRGARFQNDILVHGDLYARHLIVAADPAVPIVDRNPPALVGVIDWGDVHRGDRYLDLALAHSFLPPKARDVFFHEYEARCGPVTQDTWKLARFRSLFSSMTIAVYGHDIGDRALRDEGLWALDNLTA